MDNGIMSIVIGVYCILSINIDIGTYLCTLSEILKVYAASEILQQGRWVGS